MTNSSPIIAHDSRTFVPVPEWPRVPAEVPWVEVPAVAVDASDRVYLFCRGDHPVIVFDSAGERIMDWGQGMFARPHGIAIGPDGMIYCTDDLDHTVKKFTPDGKLLMTLGTNGKPSDTGATSVDYRSIQRVGPPFHFPTNVAFSQDGEIYVSDGYGNARIHKFSPEGKLLKSWGDIGTGPGQFQIPHGIAVDSQGAVHVADRENSRVQRFTADGEYLDELVDIARPCQILFDANDNMFVAELGYRAGMWAGILPPSPDATGGRISVFDRDRRLIDRWGGGNDPTAPGDFFAPHDIAIDSSGNLYVAEVVWSAGAKRGMVSPTCHSLQKFRRRL